jgi:hypothetical protein
MPASPLSFSFARDTFVSANVSEAYAGRIYLSSRM